MSYNAIVLADSISPAGHRVTTLEVTFPRFILAEFNTHRVLSRNSASSRAIPVLDRVKQIEENPFVPEAFGKNGRGMRAAENLTEADDQDARAGWIRAAGDAIEHAQFLANIKVHKEHANRLLEPYAWHTVVCTATEWDNWDALRVSKLAQPEMYKIAGMMREVRTASVPLRCEENQWHLPYVRGDITIRTQQPEGHWLKFVFEAEEMIRASGVDPIKVCVGRCAAVSYERQSSKSDMEKDAARCDSLVANGHMSPLEHALRPMTSLELDLFDTAERVWNGSEFCDTGRSRHFLGNVEGWVQYRKLIPGEAVYRAPE